MKLQFEATDDFEKELGGFPPRDKKQIINKINHYCGSLLTTPEYFYKHTYRPHTITLSNEYESTLYVLRINKDIRVILTTDEDPLFDQFLITLIGVARHDSLDKKFKGIAESLYQQYLHEIKEG